jgi:hypothetical protein
MVLTRDSCEPLLGQSKSESLQTFLIHGQSVSWMRELKGDNVPKTTAFILASTSVRSGEVTRMTNSAVVVSDTPYRLMASVIYRHNLFMMKHSQ